MTNPEFSDTLILVYLLIFFCYVLQEADGGLSGGNNAGHGILYYSLQRCRMDDLLFAAGNLTLLK